MTPTDLYAALLRCYPAPFRREYGDDMTRVFDELSRAHTGSRAALWLFVAADTWRAAPRAHAEAWRSRLDHFTVRWVSACAAGAIAAGLLGNALTYAFRYLYHPYLEGWTVPPWAYGALLGLVLGLTQAAAVRHAFRLGLAWVLTSTLGTACGLHAAVAILPVAGPIGYGIVLGGFVGGSQWALLRTRVRQASWWVLTSTAAVSLSLLSSAAALRGALTGLGHIAVVRPPLAPAPYRTALDFLERGLNGPATGNDLAVECAVLAICGLVIAVLTAKPLSSLAKTRSG